LIVTEVWGLRQVPSCFKSRKVVKALRVLLRRILPSLIIARVDVEALGSSLYTQA
jgi:hypothetical protein